MLAHGTLLRCPHEHRVRPGAARGWNEVAPGGKLEWRGSDVEQRVAAELAAGLQYQVAIDKGAVDFHGSAGVEAVVGDAGVVLQFGSFTDPDFPHVHAIGPSCVSIDENEDRACAFDANLTEAATPKAK